MDLKQKAGPAAVVISVVALLAVIYLIAHFSMGGNRAQQSITKDNRPEYVKQMERGQRPSWVPVTTQPGTNTPVNQGGQMNR